MYLIVEYLIVEYLTVEYLIVVYLVVCGAALSVCLRAETKVPKTRYSE